MRDADEERDARNLAVIIRPPAVAGTFYEARPERLADQVRKYLPADSLPRAVFGAIVPHAGYVYSGPVAGAVFARLTIPKTAIILCPNHTGRGAPASIENSDAWRTPLGDVAVNRELSNRLLELAPSVEQDKAAHAREHSLEVELPFLQILRADVDLVAICVGAQDLDLCREIGLALARLRAEVSDPPILIASSDMNHYESREIGARKDAMALERVEAVDPEGLFETVLRERISMCGFLPATALLFAARAAGCRAAHVVARRDSGDQTGDTSSVVGYAGVVVASIP